MSILRNAFDQNVVDQEQANFLQEQADAQGMGAIRRGWNAGRVGGDLNAARIDEAAALAAGDAQKAALLGQQREHLEQRQALYAPGVGKVEDIRGLGDALSWAGTQVGQGAASMADPAALGAAGTALGKLPGPFKLAPLAAGIGAFALNQRQMAGEHVGRLRGDPTAMANLGAKGVYDQANLVGAAGGALDTLFPFAVGRAFGGAALRQGAGGLMGRSFGAKTLGGMAMEGGTEVAQGEIGRFAHTDANALRNTGGDWSDRLNEFAGGAVGGAPFSAAGAAADMAYGGTARAGEVVKEKAGEVVDMAAEKAEKAKQAYKDSGLKGAVDLGIEGTKSVFEKAKEYVGDQVSHDAAIMRAVADVERYTMTPQEFALLTEAPPPPDLPPDQQRAWTDEMFGKRQAHLFEKMLSLEEQGVPEATQFVDRMTSDDPLEATKAVYDATDFLFERHAAAAAQQRSAVLKAMSGGFIQQAAKKMTRGAKVVGDAAAFAGLNVAEGVRQGLGKKNKQGVAEEGDHSSPRQLDYETWERMREAGGVGAGQGELFGRPSAARVEFTADEQKHAIARANKLFERGDEKPIKTDPVAAARSLERATLFAEIMAAEARARKQRVVAHRVEQDGDGDAIGIENFARYVAYEIADMAESWSGRAGQTAHPTAKDGGQAKVAVSLLDSMADDIVGLVGSAAGSDVVSRMAQQGAPESQPFFELLQERVTNWRGNAAERAARERTARDQMVALLPQQFQADLLADDGIGARKMYETIGAIARGLITPQKRKEIEQYIPRETLNQMLTLYGATVPDRGGSAESGWMAGDDSEAFDPDRLSMNDDGDVVEGASDFEKNMGEKALSRGGVGQKRYGHSKSPAMRESPFAPAKRMSKEEYIAFRELERERRMAGEPADVYPEVERPRLFTKGQKYSDGRDAIEARIETMSEKLGPDFSVTARSAQDVMDASNMHAASRLAIFRDYMFAASRDISLPVEAQLTAKNRAHLARKALLDALDDPSALEGLRRNKAGDANMTEEQKSASGFGTPGVVEQWVEELLKDYEKAGGVRQNKKVEDTPPPRLTPDERKMLYAGMENYFRSRYVVEAERQIDRESSRIDAVEIRKMIEKGRGTYDVLKRDYGDGTDEMKAAMADSNLLWFKSTLHDERTGKPDEVPISANTLVGWVRKQRSLSEEYSGNDERLSNRNKNDAFLSDLYEGISILMNSGFMTDDLPYLKGPDGEPQTFEDATIAAKNKKLGVVTGRIPANLQLETTTGSGYMFARDERVRKVPEKRHERTKEEDSDDARDDERYQKARDWELARGDDLDDGGGNEATQIEVGEGERETLNPYEDIKRKALKASSAAYEKRLGVEQQMRELGLALQKAQEKGSAVQIAALARRINELAVVADGLPTEPPDTIEEIESRIEATRAELVAAMAAGGGDAKRIAKLGEEAAAKKRWVAPLELRGQATAASVMKQRVASLEDQRREERAPGEKISTLKRRLFELTALLDTELNKEHEKAPPGTPGAPKRARVKSLAKETLDAGDRDGIDAAYTRGGRVAALNEMQRQDNTASEVETPEERMAREAGLLGWLDDTGAQENETPTQRRARLRKAREVGLLGEAYEQGGKRAHSSELERQDTQRAAGLRNNRIDRWRVDRDVEEHVLAAAKRAADDEGLKFGSAEYREFMRNYTERRVTDRSRDSEQVAAEKVDLSMRSKMVGAGIGPEPKHSARKLAEDRAGAILETFRRHGADKGMEVLESRLRTAKATNTDGGAGTVGGAHYAWPLAHILNKRQIEDMDLAATDPQDLKILRRLLAMRSELAKVIHDSTSLRLADKVDMVKAMASAEGAERVTAATVMKMLAGAAQPARDAEAVAQEAARGQAAKIAAKKAARGVAATEAPKSQPPQGGAARGKLNAQAAAASPAPVRQLNKRLIGLLDERGIKIEERALEHVPPEMRVSLVNRTLMADLKEPLAEDVAKFISWMTVDSDMYQKIADGIAGTALEKAIFSEVNRDARQSMYTPVRKQREVVRRAVERLLTNGLMKRHAAEAPLPLRVVQMVRSAIKGIMEALGGVKYKDLQGLADQYVDDLLSGKITLERPRKPGTVRVDPYEAFKADQHAADLTFALTDGGGFALTGSLAYASQGSVYRPAGATIHDLDFTTSLTQRAAEQRLERLYPQAHKVRSFGGLGDFVSTYVVPPKGHRADLVVMEGGAVRAFVVRNASGKIVGRYTNNDKGENSTGVKGTVVDLISDKRGAAGKLIIPTTFGDKQIPFADVAHAMAQKLMYARDKDIIDFANFVPNSGRKLNAQGTAKAGQEKLIDEYINSPAGVGMAFEVNDEYSRAEVREMFESGALADTALGKKWAALKSAPRDTTPTDGELLSGDVEPQGRTSTKSTNKARIARQKLDELFVAAAEDFGIDVSEVEGALTDGEHQDSWAAEAYRNIVNGLDELEVIAVFEPDAKSREKLFKALDDDDDGSERSLTDVEDIEYRDVAAEDAGLLGAEPLDGGQKPREDAQEPPKSAPRALVVAREGRGAKKARKRAQRTVPTDEDIQAAKDYLRRVLGDQIRTRFGEITGYSGQWIEDENVIEVSTLTLAGALNVARHEALHAFWSKFVQANPQAIKVLSSLTNDPRILRRLETLLADDPHALEQLADGEERLAYIYQFAMAGQLKLPHTPGTTLMSKIRKFLRQVFMMVRDDERAVDLLYAFEAGQMSKPDAAVKAVAKAINQGTWARKAARGMDGVVQGAAALVLPASTILATSSSRTAREVGKMFFTNPGEEGSAEGGTGYLNARNQKMRAYNNLFRAAIEDLDDRQLKELTEVMQNETPSEDINDPDVAQAKEKLHQMFARFHKYLTEERGLRMGEIRENYFPVVYDPDKVRAGLRDMLTSPKYIGEMNKMVAAINKNIAKGNAFLEKQGALEETRDPVTLEEVLDGIVNHITRDNPTDDIEMEPKRQDGVLRPWFAGGERRVLFFLDPEDRAKFQEKDIILTATRYLRQGVRAAEYSSRFGRDGRLLAQKVMVGGEMTEIGMLPNIRGELYEESHDMLKRGELKDEKARKKWVDRQYRDVARAIGAMEGSLGHDVSELVRNVNAASIVYQNIRLLPLALFSSFVDPLGIIAGGGTMSQAWDTFGRGIRGVIRQWGDMVREQPPERAKDEWEKLAELAGVIDSATFSHLLTDEYGSVYLGSKASKANELMFKANGMEAWNRGMRVGATKAAVAFMERHNKGGDKHSERWLRDLGFEVGGLKLDSDGRMITGKRDLMAANPGMSLDEAEAYIDKVHAAINRWVESTILSPNAAQRPAWGSDPHYGMFWHLKQFAYSFHQTIMKRAINEAGHGNYAPLGVFAWYIPAMIVSDVVKGLALGAGELPAHMKGYNLGDWMMHGVRRAGILGIGDIGIEGLKDPTGLAGPSVEQATDFFFKPLEENLVRALPANALYSRAIL